MFSDAYSGERTALSPTRLLHAWWMLVGGHLAGYQQHDAHEFLLCMLGMLTGPTGEWACWALLAGTAR